MAYAQSIVEAFSLSHAQVLDGATAFSAVVSSFAAAGDVYGVEDASLSAASTDYDNTGDDALLGFWSYLNRAECKVKAGYLSFQTISLMTGVSVSSSVVLLPSGETAQSFETELWHEDSFNSSRKPVALVLPSKDSAGNARRLIIGLYSCQFKPISFDGPKYKDGLKVNYDFAAVATRYNELGVAHADGKLHIGKLISKI